MLRGTKANIQQILFRPHYLKHTAAIFLTTHVKAEVAGPGWFAVEAEPVSPEEAKAYFDSKRKDLNALTSSTIISLDASSPEITDEITELARALQHDPKLIYEYVRNHIDYVPYFGSLKGVTLTLLERSGNDFDQASLMIALLRASGFTAQYVYGQMTIPSCNAGDNYDLQHWLGVDANFSVIAGLLAGGGIPATVSTQTTLDRVWVKATIGGNNYLFDPAFKIYEDTPGIDLVEAMGYDKAALLSAAGGEVGTDYVRNLNESGFQAKLGDYAANLISFLRANHPNASIEEIIGDREIIPKYLTELPTNLKFSNVPQYYWDSIPSEYIHKVHIQHGGIDQWLNIPEIAGKRLSITYDTGVSESSTYSSQSIIPTTTGTLIPAGISSTNVSKVNKAGPGLYEEGEIAALGGSWDFGQISVGSWSEGSMTISNPNTVTVNVIVSLINNPSGAFSIISGGGSHDLGQSQQHEIVVRFSGEGQSPGAKTAQLRIEWWHNGSRFADNYTDLSGTIAQALELDGYGVNVGQCYLDNPRDGTCRLINDGSLSLTINSITLTGADAGRFQILSGGGSGTIPAGSYRDINVRYLADVSGTHSAWIHVELTYDGVSYNGFDMLPLSGETISAPSAQLWLDDEIIAEETAPVSEAHLDTMTLEINHPYSADEGTYCDQTSTYNLKRGASYVIVSDFGGSKNGLLLKKRQRMLDAYRAGFSDSSRQVLCETLNVMGQTWMKQTTLNQNLLAKLSDVISIRHHRFGIMAQEEGYYIDVKTQMGSNVSRHNDASAEKAVFRAGGHLMSAMEHGVLEQLQVNRPAASTVKLLQIANAEGNKVFFVTSGSYASIEPQLTGYSDQDKQDFQSRVNAGGTLVLPANGEIVLGEWMGKGYIDFSESAEGSHVGMIIGGDYYGAYSATEATIDSAAVRKEYVPKSTKSAHVHTPESDEPVDLATGAYVFDHKDLSLGSAGTKGLQFSRSYSSDNRDQKTMMGNGWTHNYNMYTSVHSDAESGLGMRRPVDAASLITASVATLDLMRGETDVKDWMTSALVGKWAIDQLMNNAVSVHLKSEVLTYLRLPDGSYSAPPGITMKLIKAGSLFCLEERFDTRIYFNSDNRISSLVDADGNTVTFSYSGDSLQTIQDDFGHTLTLHYAGDLITSVSDSAVRSASYGYDAAGNLTSYTDPEGKVWSYGYDAGCRMTSLTNPLNITTAVNTYDSLGRVDTQTVPRQDGGSATYNFYFSGFRNIEEDPEGNQTIYYFDHKGRTIGQENALGHKSIIVYDGQNHIVKTFDPRMNTTTFSYDDSQNLNETINALGYKTHYTYDDQQRQTDIIDHLGHSTHFDYDTEHHLIGAITYPESGKAIRTSATYYANGLNHTTTDGRGTTTTITYDSHGTPVTAQVGSEPPAAYSYDSTGKMESLTDQVNATTRFVYDDRGLILSKTDPLGRTTSFTYYDDGRLHTKTDRNADTTTYTYTPSGKVDTIVYPDTSAISFSYDQLDHLTGMTDSIGTTSYTYDVAGRLTSLTNPHGFAVSYAYDEAGDLIELTYPGNKKVYFSYDALNRLKTVTNWLGQTASYTYDQAGRLTDLNHLNGTLISYGYDNANRLTDLQNTKSDTTAIATYRFSLDDNGNRTGIDRTEPLIPILGSIATNYTYNAKKNRLLTAGDSSFTYDLEGQLADIDGTPYTFDGQHRLISIDGPTACRYSYDGAGNRLEAIRDGVTTRYIYDASGNLLAEADENNTITRYYIHGLGLLAMVTPSNDLYCYHYNATGSTIAMTDGSQKVVNKYAYTPFGIITNAVEAVPQPFKYIGRHGVMTEPNGFYYMRARYYDPQVGRFISEDPIGFGGGDVNLYAYVLNNPLLFIDPWGLCGNPVSQMWNGAISAVRQAGRDIFDLALNGDPFVKTSLGAAAVTTAGPIIGAVAIEAGSAATILVLSDPVLLPYVADFTQGFFVEGPPPATPAGYHGSLTRRMISDIYKYFKE